MTRERGVGGPRRSECIFCHDCTNSASATDASLIQISASSNRTCGIVDDGEPDDGGPIRCWRFGSAINPPDHAYSDFALGESHACGLHDGGQLTCWGSEYGNRVDGPNSASGNFRDVTAGGDHTCAIRVSTHRRAHHQPRERGAVVDVRATASGKFVFGVEDVDGEVSYFTERALRLAQD